MTSKKSKLNLPANPAHQAVKKASAVAPVEKLKPFKIGKMPTGAPDLPGIPTKKAGRPKKYRPGF